MRFYLIVFIAVISLMGMSFWAGGRVGIEKCRSETAIRAGKSVIQKINENQKNQRKINEEVFTTDMHHIRLFLYKGYTIAD